VDKWVKKVMLRLLSWWIVPFEVTYLAEITSLLDLSGWPAGMRLIVRRERPHPGAQLSLFEEADEYRAQVVAINTAWAQLLAISAGLIAWLRLLALTPELAKAEPKALRYRLLHVPAKLTTGGRLRRLRIKST